MPEWNLVLKFPVKKCANILTFLVLVAMLQTGCSELRQSTLDRDFFGNKQPKSSWNKDPIDSADQYIAETNQAIKAEPPMHQARILDISDDSIDLDETAIRLVANPAALSAVSAQKQATDSSQPSCDHLAQCDCYKRQLKPKLPHAEPIEPPPMDSALAENEFSSIDNTVQVPPTALVSQPLTPILFDSETRKLQINEEPQRTLNSLRRNEPWSYEKPARIEDKPENSTPSTPDNFTAIPSEPDLVRSNKISDRVSQQKRTVNWRESDQSEITRFESPPRARCDSCDAAICDGNCDSSKRRVQDERQPIIASEQETIVATNSVESTPPLANFPTNDEINGVIELGSDTPEQGNPESVNPESVNPESALMMPNEVVTESNESPVPLENESVSSDDSDDEQWTMLWSQANRQLSAKLLGHIETACQELGCSECQSSGFPDPNCERQEPDESTADLENSQPPQQDEFRAVPLQSDFVDTAPGDANLLQSSAFPAMPIGVTAAPNSNNDFSPAAHTVDIPFVETTDDRPSATQFPASLRGNVSENIGTDHTIMPITPPLRAFDPESLRVSSELPRMPGRQISREIETGLDAHFVPPNAVDRQSTASTTTVTLPVLPASDSPVFVPDGSPTPLLNRLNPTTDEADSAHPIARNLDEPVGVDATDPQQARPAAGTDLDQNVEVNLQLLEVLERQMAELEERQHTFSKSEKQYWRHQLDAIGLVIEDGASTGLDPVRQQSAMETLFGLRKSFERNVSNANLKVTNAAFCTEITGFGQFKAFPNTTFRPGKRLLIYCEIENYTSVVRSSNYHTTLRGSFVIHNPQGRAVQQAQFAPVEDISGSRRQDFYMYFPVQLADLPPGEYKLDLIVEDTLGNKMASLDSGLSFLIE